MHFYGFSSCAVSEFSPFDIGGFAFSGLGRIKPPHTANQPWTCQHCFIKNSACGDETRNNQVTGNGGLNTLANYRALKPCCV